MVASPLPTETIRRLSTVGARVVAGSTTCPGAVDSVTSNGYGPP